MLTSLTDIQEHRIEFAKKLGAEYTLLVDRNAEDDDLINDVIRILGERPDKCIDCNGAEKSMRLAIQVK